MLERKSGEESDKMSVHLVFLAVVVILSMSPFASPTDSTTTNLPFESVATQLKSTSSPVPTTEFPLNVTMSHGIAGESTTRSGETVSPGRQNATIPTVPSEPNITTTSQNLQGTTSLGQTTSHATLAVSLAGTNNDTTVGSNLVSATTSHGANGSESTTQTTELVSPARQNATISTLASELNNTTASQNLQGTTSLGQTTWHTTLGVNLAGTNNETTVGSNLVSATTSHGANGSELTSQAAKIVSNVTISTVSSEPNNTTTSQNLQATTNLGQTTSDIASSVSLAGTTSVTSNWVNTTMASPTHTNVLANNTQPFVSAQNISAGTTAKSDISLMDTSTLPMHTNKTISITSASLTSYQNETQSPVSMTTSNSSHSSTGIDAVMTSTGTTLPLRSDEPDEQAVGVTQAMLPENVTGSSSLSSHDNLTTTTPVSGRSTEAVGNNNESSTTLKETPANPSTISSLLPGKELLTPTIDSVVSKMSLGTTLPVTLPFSEVSTAITAGNDAQNITTLTSSESILIGRPTTLPATTTSIESTSQESTTGNVEQVVSTDTVDLKTVGHQGLNTTEMSTILNSLSSTSLLMNSSTLLPNTPTGVDNDRRSTELGVPEEAHPPTSTVDFLLMDKVTVKSFDGVLRITSLDGQTAVYNSSLSDRKSLYYQKVAGDVERYLDNLYKTLPQTAGVYINSTVWGFRNGSIIVNYTTLMTSISSITADDLENLTTTAVADGVIPGSSIEVDPTSTRFSLSPPRTTPASTTTLLSTTTAPTAAQTNTNVSTTALQTPGNGTTVTPGDKSVDGVLRIVKLDRMPAVFNTSLDVPGSFYYQTLHDNVVTLLDTVFNIVPQTRNDYLRAVLRRFSNGSVIADFSVFLKQRSNLTPKDLEDEMKGCLRLIGGMMGEVRIIVDPEEITFKHTDECKWEIDDCSQYATCEDLGADGFTCRCQAGTTDALTLGQPGRECLLPNPQTTTPASTTTLLSSTATAPTTAQSKANVSTTALQTPKPLDDETPVAPGEKSFDGVLRIVKLDKIPAVFNTSLDVPGNSYYLTLHYNVVKLLDNAFNIVPQTKNDYLRAVLRRFSNGSVIADFSVFLKQQSNLTPKDLEDEMKGLLGLIGGTMGEVKIVVDPEEITFKHTDECKWEIDNCSQYATCENLGANGFTCHCQAGTTDALTLGQQGRECLLPTTKKAPLPKTTPKKKGFKVTWEAWQIGVFVVGITIGMLFVAAVFQYFFKWRHECREEDDDPNSERALRDQALYRERMNRRWSFMYRRTETEGTVDEAMYTDGSDRDNPFVSNNHREPLISSDPTADDRLDLRLSQRNNTAVQTDPVPNSGSTELRVVGDGSGESQDNESGFHDLPAGENSQDSTSVNVEENGNQSTEGEPNSEDKCIVM